MTTSHLEDLKEQHIQIQKYLRLEMELAAGSLTSSFKSIYDSGLSVDEKNKERVKTGTKLETEEEHSLGFT